MVASRLRTWSPSSAAKTDPGSTNGSVRCGTVGRNGVGLVVFFMGEGYAARRVAASAESLNRKAMTDGWFHPLQQSSDHAVLVRKGGGRRACCNIKLCEDIADMPVDGPFAQAQFGGDRFVRLAVGHQAKHLQFA